MSSRPLRKGELVQRGTDQTWAIYEHESDSLHELNASARAIWELCDGETTPEEMATALSELTGMELPKALGEVTKTIDTLASSGLVSY